MKKVLLVQKSYSYDDGYTPVGIILDIEKGNKYIERMNIPYNEEFKLCMECSGCAQDIPFGSFKFKETCGRSNILTDRNGEYCEGMKLYYGMDSIQYYGKEIEIIELED